MTTAIDYETEFYETEKPDYLDKMASEWQYWRDCVYYPRMDTLRALLGDITRTPVLLDVGCGGGFFVQAAMESQWAAIGIEPSKTASAYLPDTHVINDYFERHDFGDARFDVVHISFVLEHIPDPAGMLKKAYDLLLPGGIICVEVPNDFNPLQKHLRDSLGFPEYWVQPRHHLSYFSPESLHGMLKEAGFKHEFQETTFPMEFFLLMGDNYVEDDALGLACHKDRMCFEINLMASGNGQAIKKQLYKAFSEMGIGRSLVQYARK